MSSVNLSGRLNYCATSIIAELCAIRIALRYLFHLPVRVIPVIITNCRAALSSLANKPAVPLFVRQIVDTVQAVEDVGFSFTSSVGFITDCSLQK